ncbi:MAG: hypothetical protein ABS76_25710 [Pelagibacterium sp. SCN 64-44]|nr:MAG: hypothetical protein ABS76_25710 [Pelagibacterium sp. SCN 64-44]
MPPSGTHFEIKGCELVHFGAHPTMAGRVTGVVRVRIEERFMGNLTAYPLDLKVKADIGEAAPERIRTALLAHAAHQLNKLKARHGERYQMAAE